MRYIILLLIIFSSLIFSCKDNPLEVIQTDPLIGRWERVEPFLENYRQGSSGLISFTLFDNHTFMAVSKTNKNISGSFEVSKELIPFFSQDSIYTLILNGGDEYTNFGFGIISYKKDSLTLHRRATDMVDEFYVKIPSIE